MRKGFYFLSLCCAFAAGGLLFGGGGSTIVASGRPAAVVASASAVAAAVGGSWSPGDPPAYLLAVGKRLKPPEALAAYRQAAGPLAMKAGYKIGRASCRERV